MTCPSSDGNVLPGASDSTSSASSLLEMPVLPPAGISTAAPTISTSSPNSPPAPSAASSAEPSHCKAGSSILDLDVDSNRSRSAPLPRIFNIDAHIKHLQRDVEQLEQLAADAEATFGRTIHRIKERPGRRVWSGKDVWFADEWGRVPVSKEQPILRSQLTSCTSLPVPSHTLFLLLFAIADTLSSSQPSTITGCIGIGDVWNSEVRVPMLLKF